LRRRPNPTLLLLCVLTAASCAHWQPNVELEGWDEGAGYRLANLESPEGPESHENAENTDSLFVILAFSGGGTRAAALSYGAIEQLRKTRIVWEEREKSLLDEVDVISSVSGGTFTALYYGLCAHGRCDLADFEERFLYAPIQKRLFRRLLRPWNWVRLASPHFDRIDLATELYDREVFAGATYGALLVAARRPYIIVNSTDMTLGARFEFTQDQFDFICSDLTQLPLARAAAASSAFPGLLTPATIRSYGDSCGIQPPEWIDEALEEREDNPSRYANARRVERYFERDNRYIHLIDGGVADNVGLRAALHALVSNDSPWSLVNKINNGDVEKVLVISVNAKTRASKQWNKRQNAPGLLKVLKTSGNTPLAHYSFESVDRIRGEARSQNQLQSTVESCRGILHDSCPEAEFPVPPLRRVSFHAVEINFEALKDLDQREFFQNLPTNFQLDRPVVDCLRGVAGTLLATSRSMNEFLDGLDDDARDRGSKPPQRADPPGYAWPCGNQAGAQ
jgi:predicted acylesterase/phospholipase RssA